jgi:hypothetical protein
MKRRESFLIALLFIGLITSAQAAVLKTEPKEGHLRPGQRVLVDDGSCPSGQIKEVVGGSNRKFQTSERMAGSSRQIRCIPR